MHCGDPLQIKVLLEQKLYFGRKSSKDIPATIYIQQIVKLHLRHTDFSLEVMLLLQDWIKPQKSQTVANTCVNPTLVADLLSTFSLVSLFLCLRANICCFDKLQNSLLTSELWRFSVRLSESLQFSYLLYIHDNLIVDLCKFHTCTCIYNKAIFTCFAIVKGLS